MATDFLTTEQKERYGRFSEEPSPEQLARYFYLDDKDREIILTKRGDHNRLGFAVQLGTVRFLGTFLSDPTNLPSSVLNMLARQLLISDASCINLYLEKESRLDHTADIREKYNYRNFTDQPEHFRLVRWLYERVWLDTDRPSVLFDLTTEHLVSRKILLPAASTLSRLIASVRNRATTHFHRLIVETIPLEQREMLEGLLGIEPETRQTSFDRLRKPPTYLSGPGLVRALRRIEDIRELGISFLQKPEVPASRVESLARHALSARAQAILRMPEDRRLSTLYAFALMLEANAHDDALDIFGFLIQNIFTKAEQVNKRQRVRKINDLDDAARRLSHAVELMLEKACPYQDVRAKVLLRLGPERVIEAMATVDELTRPSDDLYYPELQEKYRSLRRYWPHVLETIGFSGTQAAEPILKAIDFLTSLEHADNPFMEGAPMEIVTPQWQRYVISEDGSVDRKAYTFCLLDRLRGMLNRREVFVPASGRYADPRKGMLEGEDWEAARAQVCRTLGRSVSSDEEVGDLTDILDATYRRVAENLSHNPDARIERVKGKDELVISPLGKLEEPPSCKKLRKAVASLLPRVDLPEILLEIHSLTGFADEFTHINESESRAEDLHISICACLLAEACNIGMEPLVRSDIPALTRGRFSWTRQSYIRTETLMGANARLVKAQSDIPLAQEWGGGHVASVDGLRFVVPVRTIRAGPSPKYFNRERGITYYNMTSDQGTGLNWLIEPGTIRDSLFLLAVVLGQQTHLEPTEIMTDTGSYTDIIFGIFWLLGYQFCPRLADMGGARFWRVSRDADYGLLNGISRNVVNTQAIHRNWDDVLRLAGSLKLGLVHPLNLIRTLQKGDKVTELQKALMHIGRINKTIYMLNIMDDPCFRRRVLTQMNIHEGRHSLARTSFHGQKGELRKRYREGQEDQLGALGLLVNVIVLWNTIYMNRAIDHLKSQGAVINPEDVARLSPFGHKHINYLGRYSFSLPEPVQEGRFRPLRTPEDALEPELEDDFRSL